MALEITESGSAILEISGTTTTVTSVYARIDFNMVKTGETMQGGLSIYASKTDYTTDMSSVLNLKDFPSVFAMDVDVATEEQSLQTGHDKIKAQLEVLGYSVVIVDLP